MKSLQFSCLLTIIFFSCISLGVNNQVFAQEPDTKVSREQVLKMTYDDLLSLPLGELMELANIVGVSADELLTMILNMELTTASKKSESLFESPLSTSVITADEIQRSGASTIEEALRLVPGLIVREKTNGNYDVHIRGLDNVPSENFSHFSENTISLVMVDGVPVYNNVAGGTFWETIPVSLSRVERIDVVRGPSTALYGPNAVSGVVNIITKDGGDKKLTVNSNHKAGSYNTYTGDLFTSYKLTPKFTVNVDGKYDYRDRYHDLYYSYLEGEFLEDNDSILNITDRDYFRGPSMQSIPKKRAREIYAGNMNVLMNLRPDIKVSLTGGIQHSKVNTVFFENIATPFSVRASNTAYGSMHAVVKGFTGYVSYQKGVQNLSEGMVRPVIEYNMDNVNANLEYFLEIGSFSIRPGVNYQKANYDDLEFEESWRIERNDPNINGLFHGKKNTSLLGGSLRVDYTAFEKLRLIAAMRADKYDYVKEVYPSYQFVASYKANDNHLFRLLFSRANRGAFVGDLHANFKNPILSNVPVAAIPQGDLDAFKAYLASIDQTAPLVGLVPPVVPIYGSFNQYYLGTNNTNRELKLMTMHSAEIGWRGKLGNHVQVDIEAFGSVSRDFNALVSYESRTFTSFYTLDQLTQGFGPAMPTPLPSFLQIEDSMFYENLPLLAIQSGVSGTVNVMVLKNLHVKAYGTVQQTNIRDHVSVLGDTLDYQHKNTPSFYGGMTVIYAPTSKIDVFLGTYAYTSQVYNRYYRPLSESVEDIKMAQTTAEDNIKAKIILSARVSYKFMNEHKVYVEGKNLLFNDNREFGFADPVKAMVLGGVSFAF